MVIGWMGRVGKMGNYVNERGCVAKIGDCGAGDDGNRISWRMLLVTDKDRSKLQSTFSAMTTFLVIL